MIPIFEGHAHTLPEVAQILNEGYDAFKAGDLSAGKIYLQSVTSAFCVLGISELFHMIGMTSIRKSFIHNFTSKNWLLWVAFFVGIGLQIAVVNIPGLSTFFKCAQLDWAHWGYVFALSSAPLVVHEIVALVLYIRKKVKNRKTKVTQ